MKFISKTVLGALLLALAAFATGCTSKTSRDSSIPWSQPANWEGQIPGMGGR